LNQSQKCTTCFYIHCLLFTSHTLSPQRERERDFTHRDPSTLTTFPAPLRRDGPPEFPWTRYATFSQFICERSTRTVPMIHAGSTGLLLFYKFKLCLFSQVKLQPKSWQVEVVPANTNMSSSFPPSFNTVDCSYHSFADKRIAFRHRRNCVAVTPHAYPGLARTWLGPIWDRWVFGEENIPHLVPKSSTSWNSWIHPSHSSWHEFVPTLIDRKKFWRIPIHNLLVPRQWHRPRSNRPIPSI